MSLTELERPDTAAALTNSSRVARAVIVGAVIIAVGIFATNTLHDVKENHEAADLRARSANCRHWEEQARVVAFSQAEQAKRTLGVDSPDRTTSSEYWVSVAKVQKWYPADPTDPASAHVARPSYC